MSRFWQVVYSFGHAFRNWKEILGGWQDRILLAMKKPAAKVVLAVVAALLIIAFLTQGAMAVEEHKNGSVTFTAEEIGQIRQMHQNMVQALEWQYFRIQELEGQLKVEKDKHCI